MSHPLTDEFISTQDWGCVFEDYGVYYHSVYYDEDTLRTATDWQLEQVTNWLRNNLDESYIWADVMPPGIDVEDVIIDLNQAMRPTGEQQ